LQVGFVDKMLVLYGVVQRQYFVFRRRW